MPRSICYCEPSFAVAGEMNTWNFHYTTAVDLQKGTLFRFNLGSEGREIDWEIPSVDLQEKKNVIYAKLENGKILTAKEVNIPDSFQPLYEFALSTKLEAGQTFTVVVGAPKQSAAILQKQGTRTQTYSQRRRSFYLSIDTSGKKRFEEPETFSMDIKGNVLKHLNVITPSFVTKNKRFDVVVRFEDEFGNLTNNAPEGTLIELSYEHLRENLNWKLFVPETGFISLPNLYFNDPGIYTIQLKNTTTNEVFHSAPIKCFPEDTGSLYWGLLHGESVRVDSTENVESCLRHFRDERALNFYGTSCFESAEETSNDIWKLISQNVADFDETDRFTTFLGMQWQGLTKTEGLRQFLFFKDNKPVLRKKDAKYNTLKKIYKSFSPKELLSIPGFTMGKGFEFDFEDFNPEFERVVEIYNSWGSSESLSKEGNKRPIKGPNKKGVSESAEGSIIKALQDNKRFGFVAGGLDDRGCFSDLFEEEQEQYSPGLTAIIASEHSRAALWEALYNRSCYATTGERMILGFNLSGIPMGAETSTADKQGLTVNRHISGHVAGTTKLKCVEIIRNGKVIKTFHPEGYHLEFEYDDMTPLNKAVIDAKDGKSPFVFYYLRAEQENGHIAWSSPIWVDYHPQAAGTGGKKAAPTSRAAKKALTRASMVASTKEIEDDFDDKHDDLEEFDVEE